jgi:hypothetical protein
MQNADAYFEGFKVCPRCGELKALVEFGVPRPRNTPASYCKLCQREYSQAHYRAHSAAYRERARSHSHQYIRRNRERVRAFLSGHPCVDCGTSDPIVLEFDHVMDNKSADVSYMVGQGMRWERIEIEISKCQVRCANCHRRKTDKVWAQSPRRVRELERN